MKEARKSNTQSYVHPKPKNIPFFQKKSDTVNISKPFFSPTIQAKKENTPKSNLKQELHGGVVYDTRGNIISETSSKGKNIIILYNKKQIKSLRKEKKAAEKDGLTFNVEVKKLSELKYFILPPYEHRATIKNILENDDEKSHVEYGGRGVIPVNTVSGELDYDKFSHLRADDGNPAGPYDNAATINIDSIHDDEIKSGSAMKKVPSGNFAVDYTWHSHPGGKWKKKEGDKKWMTEDEFDKQEMKKNLNKTVSGDSFGGEGTVTRGYELGPSERDINNAHNRYKESTSKEINGTNGYYPITRNFVVHKREKKVFFYNHETIKGQGNYNAVIDYDVFFNLK